MPEEKDTLETRLKEAFLACKHPHAPAFFNEAMDKLAAVTTPKLPSEEKN